MRHEVRKTGKRPHDAYNEAMASVAKKFRSSDEQAAVIVEFPTFSEVRRSLYRHRSAEHTPVPDPFNLPAKLCTTVRGKSVSPEDVNYQERFLLHSGQNGRVLIFCADSELQILNHSDYIICDGTFEMAPNSSYQLYTMHGYLKGEGMPLVWALLPNKTKAGASTQCNQ